MSVFKKIILFLIHLLLLNGCSNEPDKDVVEFVKDAKAQKTEKIGELPVFPAFKMFSYTANLDKLRDPFMPFATSTAEKSSKYAGPSPDLNRPREPLELYPLDSLKMVGTLERDGEYYALIKDANNILHRVSVGNYIGQNSGRIEKITGKSIEIKEWLSDGKGGWQEHGVIKTLSR